MLIGDVARKKMNSIYHRLYIYGYRGNDAPRLIRKVLARSELHRSWFSGRMGVFEVEGLRYSVGSPNGIVPPAGGTKGGFTDAEPKA